MTNEWRRLERIVRGFSNHRRLQMLQLLAATPEQDVQSMASACGINIRTASDHTFRLVRSGLVLKRSKGRRVLHAVSPRGKAVLAVVRSVK